SRARAASFAIGASVPLEVLHFALVLLGLVARREGAEVAALAGLRIGLARVQAVLAGLELADHRRAFGAFSRHACPISPATTFSRCQFKVDAQAYDFRAPGKLFDEAGVKRRRPPFSPCLAALHDRA